MAESAEVSPGGSLVRLHLKRENPAVLELDDQVDLGSVAGTPVSEGDRLIHPRSLLAHLSDYERLQKVAELGQRGRVQTGDCLSLAGNCHQLYLSLDGSLRRITNQAFFEKLYIQPGDVIDGRPGEPFTIFFDQDVQRLAVERQRAVDSGNQTGQVDGLNIDHLVGVLGAFGAVYPFLLGPNTNKFVTVLVVGVTGFEPAASSSRTTRATKLRHTPRAVGNISRRRPITRTTTNRVL